MLQPAAAVALVGHGAVGGSGGLLAFRTISFSWGLIMPAKGPFRNWCILHCCTSPACKLARHTETKPTYYGTIESNLLWSHFNFATFHSKLPFLCCCCLPDKIRALGPSQQPTAQFYFHSLKIILGPSDTWLMRRLFNPATQCIILKIFRFQGAWGPHALTQLLPVLNPFGFGLKVS